MTACPRTPRRRRQALTARDAATVSEAVVVRAPQADVWSYILDPRRLAALNPDSLGLDRIDPPGALRAGQRWRERARTPLGPQDLFARVDEVDATHGRIHLQAEAGLGVRIDTVIAVGPPGSEGGTPVAFTHRVHLPAGPVAWLAGDAVLGRLRESTHLALQRLVRALEPSGS
jgi:hypothetical protein